MQGNTKSKRLVGRKVGWLVGWLVDLNAIWTMQP